MRAGIAVALGVLNYPSISWAKVMLESEAEKMLRSFLAGWKA